LSCRQGSNAAGAALTRQHVLHVCRSDRPGKLIRTEVARARIAVGSGVKKKANGIDIGISALNGTQKRREAVRVLSFKRRTGVNENSHDDLMAKAGRIM
jgi:hypothetical protein